MNNTLKVPPSEQAPQQSAVPLRIALLVLPSPHLNASSSELACLLPELSSSGLLTTQSLVRININDLNDTIQNSFEEQLNATIQAIDEGKLVQLSTAEHSLLMMPALKAAQLRIHPHAQLCAMQRLKGTSQETQALALSQAKRELATVSKIEHHHELNSQQQFAAVHQLITQLASRTLFRNENNLGIELGPKQAKSHYWFTDCHQARVVAINFTNDTPTHSATSFILTQGTGFIAPKSMVNAQRLQFILAGDNQDQLLDAIDKLHRQLLATSLTLLPSMQANLIDYVTHNNKATFAAVLQACSLEAMLLELGSLKQALPQVFAEQGQYKTPSGSYFTAKPLGNKTVSGLAFVYPGVGTVYADMLSALHEYFPALYARLEREGNLKSMLQAASIYHLDAKVTPAMSLGEQAIAGVGSSYLLTQLLIEEFKITPNFALGYSMGEASMWASLGVWDKPHALIDKTQTDPLFTSAISGSLTAVKKAWKLSLDDSDLDNNIVWNSFIVRSAPEPIQALLNEFPHAYLAIIQGDTCVIAGCETQCRSLLTKLGKRGIAANRVTAMHTTPAMEEHANVIAFYTQPLTPMALANSQDAQGGINPNEIKFISAADLCSQTPRHEAVNNDKLLNSEMIASTIADTFCHTLDFTALIHSAQKQGAKLFVELGADRQNCTLIDKIAKLDRSCGTANTSAADYPCCTVPVNAKGGDDITTLLKALGQLISHRVPLSVQPLIEGLNREIAMSQLHGAHMSASLVQPCQNTLLKGEVS